MDHLQRGLALGSGPDEKVALRLYVSTRPQCKADLRQYQTPVQGDFAAEEGPVQGEFAAEAGPVRGDFAAEAGPVRGDFAAEEGPVQGEFTSVPGPSAGRERGARVSAGRGEICGGKIVASNLDMEELADKLNEVLGR